MKHKTIIGQTINESSDRSREIQLDLEDILNMVARAHLFNWTTPLHEIVRGLMNDVNEFQPLTEKERW